MTTRARHLLRIIYLALLWEASTAAQSRFSEVDKIVASDK